MDTLLTFYKFGAIVLEEHDYVLILPISGQEPESLGSGWKPPAEIQLPAVRFHKFHETSALIALLSTTLTDILPNVLQLRLQCLDLFAKHFSDFLTNLLQLSGQGLMRSQGP